MRTNSPGGTGAIRNRSSNACAASPSRLLRLLPRRPLQPPPPLHLQETLMHDSPAEWLYLDQESVLAAGVLDMGQAMHAVGQAFALLEQGQARQPEKVVL